MRTEIILSALVTFIFIGIQKLQAYPPALCFRDCHRIFIQSVRRQQVVMVQQPGIQSRSMHECFVGITGNPFIFRKPDITYPLVLVGIHNLFYGLIPAGVRQYQFKAAIGLCQYGVYHFPQVVLRCPVSGD